LGTMLAPIINSSFTMQNFYERRLSALLHARQITYVMQAEK